MAEITLEGISKRFPDGTEAVRTLDLTIQDGEFFILVGPSGCGKSTVLNMIVGLEEPTEGEIRIDGNPVSGLDPRDRNMAMVFQSYAIYPHMTVRENMAFPLRLAGMSRSERDERVERAAEILELGPLLDRKPAALSGGQRQRVAMGRAITREPSAFLLDEPLSNLDARLRAQMRSEIGRLQRRLGTTTVYVTHDQAEAMTLGDHIGVLHRGELQQVGTPRDLYRRPKNLFVAGFIGSPAMNFLPARVAKGRLILPMMQIPLGLAMGRPENQGPEEKEAAQTVMEVEEGPYIAGIRPESFAASQEGGDTSATAHPSPTAEASPTSHTSSTPHASFTTTVELLEWMGADLFVHFEVDTRAEGLEEASGKLQSLLRGLELEDPGGKRHQLVARLTAGSDASEGDALDLQVPPGQVMLFDPETGHRIEAPSA